MKIPAARIENFVVDAKDNGNEVMKHVWLDVEGQRLIATNGHMACRVSIECGDGDVTGLIPVEAFELARKELKVISKILGKDTIPDPQLSVIVGEDTVIVQNLLTTTSHLVTRRKLSLNEKFPNADAVFPVLTKKPSVSLDAGYVADIVKSLDGDGLSIWVQGEDKSVFMASAAGQAAVVLMPRKEEVDVAGVNLRGKSRDSLKQIQQEVTELLDQMDAHIEVKMPDEAPAPTPYYELRKYLEAHLDDDPLMFPEGADPDECSQIVEELRSERAVN